MTVLINKPMGYVSGQAEDGYQPAVVLVKPENRWADDPSPEQFHPTQLRSLVPAGRLDIDSVGLLVLTQDGRIAKQLIGEDTRGREGIPGARASTPSRASCRTPT